MTNNAKTIRPPEFESLTFGDDTGAITETITVLKRRTPRIDVQHFDPPITISGFGIANRVFRVKNVAEYGAAFFSDGVDLKHETGRELVCQLSIDKVNIPLRCRILYIDNAGLIGIEFHEPAPTSRLALRTHFFFEFGVVNLGISPKMISRKDGRARTLAYGNTETHGMEVQLEDGRLEGFKIGLAHIGAEVSWQPRFNAMRVLVNSGDGVPAQYVRNQLVGFLRNVRGLNPKVRQSMENVCAQAHMEFEQI